MNDALAPLIKQFLPFAQERMGFEKPPRLFLRSDAENAKNPLGKTAYYDPEAKSVTLYVVDRHPKDIMRSLSHELVHHTQNCNGQFDNAGEMGEGYAQNNEHLREMERQAYEVGNLCFRDWEDSIKNTIYFEHLHKGANKRMSIKNWKNRELGSLLSEAWGFGFTTDKLDEDEKPDYIDLDKDGDKEESMKDAAADMKEEVETADVNEEVEDDDVKEEAQAAEEETLEEATDEEETLEEESSGDEAIEEEKQTQNEDQLRAMVREAIKRVMNKK